MAAQRSFTEYVKKRFDNNFWAAAESYLDANLDSLGIELKRIQLCVLSVYLYIIFRSVNGIFYCKLHEKRFEFC